jgi:hypothetical protein
MTTLTFWLAAAERAVKTFAQALLALLTASSAPLDLLHTNWVGCLSVAAGAAVLSVLTSLTSLGDAPGKHADPTGGVAS